MSTSPRNRYPLSLDYSLGLLFLAICILRFQHYLVLSLPQASDLCWLLRTGDWIIANRQLPTLDLFVWYSPQPVISYQWLFEVIAAALHKWIGIWGLGLISNSLAAFFLYWYLPCQWIKRGIPAWLTFLFISLIFSPYWQYPRPQIMVWVFFQILLIVLNDNAAMQDNSIKKRSWWLPLLFVLWANTHPTVFIGYLFLVIFLAKGIFKGNVSGKWQSIALLSSCLLAMLLTPATSSFVSHAFSFIDGSQYLGFYEVLPTYKVPELYPFMVYVAISAILLLLARKTVSAEAIIISFIGCLLAISVNRFEPLAVIATWSPVGIALSKYWTVSNKDFISRFYLWRWSFLLVLCFSTVAWKLHVPDQQAAVGELLYHADPKILALPKERQKERLFNDPILGNWLIYIGRVKPFISNQFDNYSKKDVQEIADCLNGEHWSEFLEEKSIESILLPNYIPLNKRLAGAQNWHCIARDQMISYWERRSTPRSP